MRRPGIRVDCNDAQIEVDGGLDFLRTAFLTGSRHKGIVSLSDASDGSSAVESYYNTIGSGAGCSGHEVSY